MEATLGYWNIRGLGHSIRLLLEYTKTPYKEKRYVLGGKVQNNELKSKHTQVGRLGIVLNTDMTEWTSVKEKLGLDFPNLPYLIDGDRKISQSNAILRYIARKHKMWGETEEEMIRMDMLENHLMDFRMNFTKLCYNPDFLTYIDFVAYDTLDVHQMLHPKCLDQFPNLKEFLHHFEALEMIAPYLESSRCIRSPIFGSCVMWGGNKIRKRSHVSGG